MEELSLKSSAFMHMDKIPSKYSCEGEDINPPLEISGVPQNAKSLVLIILKIYMYSILFSYGCNHKF